MKSLLGSNDISGVHAVQWGIRHEENAIKLYGQAFNTEVQMSGLWLHPSGLIGCSPDGITDDYKIIEVKCLYSAQEELISNLAQKKGGYFLKTCMQNNQEYEMNLTHPDGWKYYNQIQGNLHLTGRIFCDLVVWTPAAMYCIPVLWNPEWISNLDKLVDFRTKRFLPTFLNGGISM